MTQTFIVGAMGIAGIVIEFLIMKSEIKKLDRAFKTQLNHYEALLYVFEEVCEKHGEDCLDYTKRLFPEANFTIQRIDIND